MRPKEPLALVELKGTNHLTKEQKQQRESEEIPAPADNIVPPDFLTAKQKKRFNEIAADLQAIGIMANIDAPALARYVVAEYQYEKLTGIVRKILSRAEDVPEYLAKVLTAQDKLFRQCRAAASDLGMTITSRCRIVIPKAEAKPKNRFDMFGDEEDASVG